MPQSWPAVGRASVPTIGESVGTHPGSHSPPVAAVLAVAPVAEAPPCFARSAPLRRALHTLRRLQAIYEAQVLRVLVLEFVVVSLAITVSCRSKARPRRSFASGSRRLP